MNTAEISDMVVVCSVCPSIRRRDKWYRVGEELIEKLKSIAKLSHTYCSPECISKSTEIPLEEARKYFTKEGSD